ncbi:MAG: Fis family transcriptional regulator [Gammaproteobacteria bacterium HGW-Gammaproteobacteria-14]|nr:MAG: Fis family transcriptional regulator [Gammaproteobacteria bacterium HGW-Gammaproteobacteria-14]
MNTQFNPKAFLHTILLAVTLLFGVASTQAVAAGKEPAIQSQPAVNINQASAAELAEVLQGVGLKRAEDIVSWRQTHGPFKSADDLVNVKGIGSSTVDKNRGRIQL